MRACREQDKYENFKGDAYAQVAISTNVGLLLQVRKSDDGSELSCASDELLWQA